MNMRDAAPLVAATILLAAASSHAQFAASPGSLARPPAQGAPGVEKPAATAPRAVAASPVAVTLYQLPPGAYTMAYRDASGALHQVDATVVWDPRQGQRDRHQVADRLTISFGGREFAGAIAVNGNRFESSPPVAGHPALGGELSADGTLSGQYYADALHAPLPFTLSRRTADAVATARGEPGVPATVRPGSREAINPQPLPPKPDPLAKPGAANAINPQPLPPSAAPNWGARNGATNAINPQPLPPGAAPNWGTRKGDANAINPQPLPPKPEPNWNSKSGTASDTAAGSLAAGHIATAATAAQPAASASGGATLQTGRREAAVAAGHVGDAAARRLRAAGLDPASPTFRQQLDARLQANARSLVSLNPTPRAAPRVADAVRAKLGPHAQAALTPARLQDAAGHVVQPATAPTPARLDALPPFSLIDYREPKGPMTMPGLYVIPFRPPAGGPKVRVLGNSASVRIAIPACAVDVTHDAAIRTAEQMGTLYANLIQNSPEWHFEGREFAFFELLTDVIDGEFALGAASRHGKLTLTVNGAAVTWDWDFVSMQLESQRTATVTAEPPFLGTNSLDLTGANASFGQPAVVRVNLTDQPMQGEDILATGIQLGAGFVAHATIAVAHSVADLGGDAAPDNAYRGATVSVQPQSNRLQTSVKWHIGPGDSLQYQVRWTLTGPEGQRALMTMPKGGVCDS